MLEYLNICTYTELKKIGRDENISGCSVLRKKPLIQHIKKHKLNLLINEGIDQLLALK
jgi:hypothetical protein